MTKSKPNIRIFMGIGTVIIVLVAGFFWVSRQIPDWGSTPEEVNLTLPGDELIPSPNLIWNHAITIHALPEQIYPWLIQMGDSRAAFYSITFIENLFCMTSGECRYVNANRIHDEWQNPPRGEQGIIMNFLVIQDYQPGEFVMARNTPELPLQWTWLWYVYPLSENDSRLIVRHRIDAPEDVPMGLFNVIMNSGYVMERAMMLGIRARAEGRTPPSVEEPLGALLWLLAFFGGILAAINFAQGTSGYHALGVGMEAIVILFILTFIQPPFWLRLVLLLLMAGGVMIIYWQKTNTTSRASRPTQTEFSSGQTDEPPL